MRQHGFTLLNEIRPDRVAPLVELLDGIGDAVTRNPHLRFERLRGLHYASLSVIPTTGETSSLVFEGNIDGRPDAFLRQLVEAEPDGVDLIYGHCVGYPRTSARSDPTRVLRYLEASDLGEGTFYVAWPGWTVEEIKREHRLRERIEALLDDEDAELRPRSPEEIRDRMRDVVAGDPGFHWATSVHPPPFLVRHGRKVAASIVGAAAVPVVAALRAATGRTSSPALARVARVALLALAGATGSVAVALRRAETDDDQRERRRDRSWTSVYAEWSGNLTGIVHREDVQVQNHMVSVTDVKAGRFRLAALRVVLRFIALVARLTANQGRLGGIDSIHFARWVLTPDRRQLIFFSNFDGSWERYLSDFIDRAARGLTAVWCNSDNAVGFPSTQWLVLGGARDEARFKAYSRYSMVPTNTWYSAYPDLTVSNIANNMAVRRDLFATLDQQGAAAWLRRF